MQKLKIQFFPGYCRKHAMKLGTTLLALLAITLLAAAITAAERIYTWTDENGVRHMTNMPPVQSSGTITVMELEAPAAGDEPATHYAVPEPLPEPAETQVTILDNHVIVPVQLAFNGRMVNARLLLDTGSTNITLHKDLAKRLFINGPQKGTIRVAGGQVIAAEAVKLDAVTVGPYTEKNLVAGIIEHHGPGVPFDGLLGMNFLKNYQYTIDFKDKVLRWGP